ncbi:hypothetical protein GOBAR_DD22621 [Gossypium barbadense]|nr:hypothetical protein GOBAR_DD22621 [Gossypium barbadense]
MAINSRKAQTMNVELYSRDLETFQVQDYIGRRSGLSPRSYTVDLRNKRCECEIFQTLRYSCAHVHTACARGNKFPVIPNVSNWKVPTLTFEILPDCSLYRHPKSRPQSTRIRNDMGVRETGEFKLCTVCRTSDHNRSACPHHVYVSGQSSRNAGLEDDE